MFSLMKPGAMLFLSREDILATGANQMDVVVPVVEEALRLLGTDDVIQPPKTTLKFAGTHEKYGGLVNVLPAAMHRSGEHIYGLKALGAMPSNNEIGIPRATGLIVLFDGKTKAPYAVMDAQVISAMRTGAVSALAARLLCKPTTSQLGLIGAGVNMRTQLAGLLYSLPDVRNVKVYSRGNSKDVFVDEMRTVYPTVTIATTSSAEEAAKDADLIVTCVANSDSPVVKKEAIDRPGVTIFNIGCLENEPALLKNMDMIVSDHWEYSKHRGVQTHAVAYQQGIITDDAVCDLSDIMRGTRSPRTGQDEKIFFCPTGLGVEDIAVAEMIYERAVARQIGTELALWDGERWT